MAGVAVEVVGREFQLNESSSNKRTLFVRNATSEAEAAAAALAKLEALLGSSLMLGGQVLKNLSGAERVKNGYEVSAEWGMFQKKEPMRAGESSFSFEIGIEPVKIVVPIENQVYKAPGDADPIPSSIHLIGDQGDGNGPQGVEIYEPTHSEQETHIVPASFVTPFYKNAVKKIVGKTNKFGFKGNQAGECLMQAVSGQQRGADDWELSFRWAVRENLAGETVAGVQVGQRRGWDYLWPVYELAKDGAANKLTNQVRYIVVSKIFRDADYGPLNIGVI